MLCFALCYSLYVDQNRGWSNRSDSHESGATCCVPTLVPETGNHLLSSVRRFGASSLKPRLMRALVTTEETSGNSQGDRVPSSAGVLQLCARSGRGSFHTSPPPVG